MNNIWKKYKITIIILSSMACIGAVLYFGAARMVAEIQKRSDEIQGAIIDNQIRNKRLEKMPEMEAVYKEIESNQKSLEVIFGPNSEVDLIKKLESLADETGNKINFKVNDQSINNDKTPKKTPNANTKKKEEEKDIRDNLTYDSYVSLQITLEGDYASLLNYIHKLENMNRYANIISIESKKIGKDEMERNYQSSNMFDESRGGVSNEQKEGQEKGEVIVSTLDVIIYTQK